MLFEREQNTELLAAIVANIKWLGTIVIEKSPFGIGAHALVALASALTGRQMA